MTVARVVGLLLVVVGVGIAALALAHLRRRARRDALRVTVVPSTAAIGPRDVALAPDSPVPGPRLELRLASHDPPVEVNVGDRLRVHRDTGTPSLARIDRPRHRWHGRFQVVSGVLVATAGGLVLGSGGSVALPLGMAVFWSLTAAGAVCLGAVGVAAAAVLVRDLPGSRTVTGTVVRVSTRFTGRKTLYPALLEYTRDGRTCRVWTPPRWFAPGEGARLTVRISGESPHEAVGTTPLTLSGRVLLLGIGVCGLGMLVGLVVLAAGW